ncbi:hypothetical protein BX659_1911 [Orenia metallireducens]|uniref:Uncharacterized protein n=2 Tax=Orenia metallireducens TaxID=1413210 RepID=A0A285IL14_9FIRM|nr:hypothetical protein BX659_1911 [Orenia metallireducens]SNY48447.1 hypothetical protein SAMN06265827_1872 [Orenia metallireducens]
MNFDMVELNEQELMAVDGGKDWGMIIGGLGTMAVGGVTFAGGVIGLAEPEPVSSFAGYRAVIGGCGTVLAGAGAVASGWRK